MKLSAQFTRKVISSRITESAMAMSKLPLPVSSTVAVVSTRVEPRMLPPSIMEAPTSEITPPKPAITAASIGRRASLSSTQSIWAREAPRPSICSRKVSGTCCTAARVSPVTMGAAITNWPVTIADGV
jgi:hypothetical protein